MLTVSVFSAVAVEPSVLVAGAFSVSDPVAALSFLSPQEANATAHAATPPIKRFLFSVFIFLVILV